MAVEPQRRDNLLFEATAFSRRLLLRLPLPSQWLSSNPINPVASKWTQDFVNLSSWELFYGRHKLGGWTVYFEQQPVLQLNSQNQLRRLYAGGQRYAAVDGHLQLLQRERLGGRVQLEPTRLSASDERLVIDSCQWFAATAADLLDQGNFSLIGQHPTEDDGLIREGLVCIAQLAGAVNIAASPEQR